MLRLPSVRAFAFGRTAAVGASATAAHRRMPFQAPTTPTSPSSAVHSVRPLHIRRWLQTSSGDPFDPLLTSRKRMPGVPIPRRKSASEVRAETQAAEDQKAKEKEKEDASAKEQEVINNFKVLFAKGLLLGEVGAMFGFVGAMGYALYFLAEGASADEADEKRWEAEVKAAEAGASGNDIHKRSSWQKTFCETFGIEMDDGTDHSLYMKLWFKIFDKFK